MLADAASMLRICSGAARKIFAYTLFFRLDANGELKHCLRFPRPGAGEVGSRNILLPAALAPPRLRRGMLLTACALAASTTASAITYQPVAMTGDAMPGTGGVFTGFNTPVINDEGDVAFAGLAGITSGSRSFFKTSSGVLELAVQSGTDAPGTGTTFRSLSAFPKFNDAGDLLFSAEIAAGSAEDTGIWKTSGGSVSLVAREGAAVPGIAGKTFSSFGSSLLADTHTFNDNGAVAFHRTFNEGGSGLFSSVIGGLQLLAESGVPVFGDAPDPMSFRTPIKQNNVGTLVGYATNWLTATPSPDNRHYAVFQRSSGGALSAIIETGDAVPGMGGGVMDAIITGFGIDINDAGDVVYNARVEPDTILGIPLNTNALLSTKHGLIASLNTTAPGTGGKQFKGNNTWAGASISGSGEVIFKGFLTLDTDVTFDNDEGIWATDSGVIKLIAREGDAAPGTTGSFTTLNSGIQTVFMNARGDVLLSAGLEGESISTSNDTGLWFYSGDTDTLDLVLQEGDTLDVNPDPLVEDLRVIRGDFPLTLSTSSRVSGLQGDSERALNEAGQFVLHLSFTDGSSGIFVVDPFATPGPIPGDTDGDGDVDDSDLGTSFSNYTGPLTPGTGSKSAAQGDTDGDGDVDDSDLGTAFSNYTGPLAINVPEPASAAIIALAGVILSRRRGARPH